MFGTNDQSPIYYDDTILPPFLDNLGIETQKLPDLTAVTDAVISQAKVMSTKVSDTVIESAREITKSIRQYLELKYDVIYGHIKKEGVVIQGELRRGENRFRKIDRKLFDLIITELEEEGLISRKEMGRKVFLIKKK